MSNSFTVTTGRDGSRSFIGDHDDRTTVNRSGRDGGGGGGSRRQGRGYLRRGQRQGRGLYQRGGGLHPRSRLEEDVEMSEEGTSHHQRRYNPYGKRQQNYGRNSGGKLAMDMEPRSAASRVGGGRGSRSGKRVGRLDRPPFDLQRSGSGWYKIMIPYANKLDKKFILETINSELTVPFLPSGFHFIESGKSAVFYVRDHDHALALKAINKKIMLPNGFKMILIVRPENSPPVSEITDEVKDRLKICMSNRYDPATKSLNMSSFYNDDELRQADIRLPLNRRNVMEVVLDVIQENIPELQSLDLTNNRLMSLDSLQPVATKAPNVTRLFLGSNNLKHQNELNKISDLKLEELHIEGNPLCDRVKDETTYVSAIRQRFPKIIKLDGHTLPPPVSFGVEEATELPAVKGSFLLSEEVQKIVCPFLDQYFKVYDSNKRQSLVEAYHDEAVFSLCACYNKLIPSKQNIMEYLPYSRNLLRLNDNSRRQKLMKVGRASVVALLDQLPASEHDPNSFVIDVSLAMPKLIVFSLKGIFRETDSKSTTPLIRYFSRTYVAVPQGQGIVIMNEELTITSATTKQIKEAFRTPAPTPSSSPVIANMPPSAPEMVQQFSVQSGMNPEFSKRCLEENKWDYETAARVFTELQAKGSIPPEAFLK